MRGKESSSLSSQTLRRGWACPDFLLQSALWRHLVPGWGNAPDGNIHEKAGGHRSSCLGSHPCTLPSKAIPKEAKDTILRVLLPAWPQLQKCAWRAGKGARAWVVAPKSPTLGSQSFSSLRVSPVLSTYTLTLMNAHTHTHTQGHTLCSHPHAQPIVTHCLLSHSSHTHTLIHAHTHSYTLSHTPTHPATP